MSLALADFLVDVADPEKLREYKADPEPFMSAFNLTNGDKAAVRSGKGGWLRLQASLTTEEADLHSDHPSMSRPGSKGLPYSEWRSKPWWRKLPLTQTT